MSSSSRAEAQKLLRADHAEACDRLSRMLRATGGLSEQSERRLLQLMLRFLRYIDRGCGIVALVDVRVEHVERFVHACSADGMAPSVATQHLRRSAVRLLFRVLRARGEVEHDPTLDLRLPARSSLATRPLTDDEIALGRSFSEHAWGETRQPAAWALAEATARTSELAAITVGDLDLAPGRVWIAGTHRTEPRWGQLTEWGMQTLEQRLCALDGPEPSTPMVYGADGSAESRQASACAAISKTLRRAGLAGEPDVRPASIAAWPGKRLLAECGQIERVAHALGVRSLDQAARLAGWDWATPNDSR